ncbi:uncharacterized protein LOC141915116 [Tubulanus polymorphus]|uniref:uncharacterized protein LOC141915116 n=1 Tax=Tubulanus polymorphus TaxID=672921 RepID=UPI003DA20D11
MLHRPKFKKSETYDRENKDDETTDQETIQSSLEIDVKKNGSFMAKQIYAIDSSVNVGMRTLPIYIGDGHDKRQIIVLLDECSDISYLSTHAVSHMRNLKYNNETLMVKVFNGSEISTKSKVCDVNIRHYNGSDKILATQRFYVVDYVCDIEGILGKDCRHLLYCLKEICGPNPSDPIARLCPLGWTCIGDNVNQSHNVKKQTHVICQTILANRENPNEEEISLDSTLKAFWEIEKSGLDESRSKLSVDEEIAQKKLEQSLKFDGKRYEIGVPWKDESPDLENNQSVALNRLKLLMKKIDSNPDIKKSYEETIAEYLTKDYIEFKVSMETTDRETTKVRIVFDGSSKYNGKSPNSEAYAGPKLQADLFKVLIPFRSGLIAMGADLSQMYLQIEMKPEDPKYHRFLWKNQISGEIEVYEFKRHVFGGTYSPCCAQYVWQTHAKMKKEVYPLAADAVDSKTYMDDTICSMDDPDVAIATRQQLTALATDGGFHYRKWMSNDRTVLEDIPESDRLKIQDNVLPKTKVLGVYWKAESDTFEYQVNVPEYHDILEAKIILQETWLKGLEWDEILTSQLRQKWKLWCEDLSLISCLHIPRCLKTRKDVKSVTLHTFGDASIRAYSTAVYQLTTYEDSVTVTLVTAKSKLAPTKSISIPKLELMAAEIGMQLTRGVCKVLKLPIEEATFWSDSYDVLFWLRGESRSYQTFVSNRVGTIHEVTSPSQWRYVPTSCYPADVTSRGCSIVRLKNEELWWHGPQFLCDNSDSWPKTEIKISSKAMDEIRKDWRDYITHETFENPDTEKPTGFMIRALDLNVENTENRKENDDSMTNIPLDEFVWSLKLSRWSRWLPVQNSGISLTGSSLVRIYAWVKRFVLNCKTCKSSRNNDRVLSPDELKAAEVELVKVGQREAFSEEIVALKKKKHVLLSSKIAGLNPYLDENGVLRSRVERCELLPEETKFPIILSKLRDITRLLIVQAHDDTAHSVGPVHILNTLRRKYLILQGSTAVKKIVNNCAYCLRWLRKKRLSQQMAPLPSIRVNPSWNVFSEIGLDFAGPFSVKMGRGRTRAKRYLLLMVDLQVRAVHLEATDSLDTDTFLCAFSRFAARRGWPKRCLSDNGGSFVSGESELKELVDCLDSLDQDKISNNLANNGVNWIWNPPVSPHFGGVFEIMIKAAKRSIKAIIGGSELNDEQFRTVVTLVEGLMNSRPLVGQDINEPMLTPNHFIVGRVSGDTAPSSVDCIPFNLRNKWRHSQEVVRQFWGRWIQEILPQLSARKKWLSPNQNIANGDIVLVIDKDLPRRQWKLGEIKSVYPGKDGLIRVVDVETSKKVYKRSIGNICPLEFNSK